MQIKDLYRFNNVNLDHFTENFNMNFYLHYLAKWPECCYIAETPDGTIAGYMIGKVEGKNHFKNNSQFTKSQCTD